MLKLSSQKAEPTSPREARHHTSCPSLSPWMILQRPQEPYEPRQTKTIVKCPLLLWFALWMALCSTAKQMSSIIKSNKRELRCASISNSFLYEGHCGTACNSSLSTTDRQIYCGEGKGQKERASTLFRWSQTEQSSHHTTQLSAQPLLKWETWACKCHCGEFCSTRTGQQAVCPDITWFCINLNKLGAYV